MVGFISGGSKGSEPPLSKASVETSMVRVYNVGIQSVRAIYIYAGNLVGMALRSCRLRAYLAIVELKDQFCFGAFCRLADELGGYPALGGIRLPRSRTDIVGRCHGGAGQAGS